ncbi:unnamed protein product, partial [Mesorhabditis belari]|uniref:Saposin B-type domain-containing protein n=1 Tax=Mesorhabditis belari TaxID=2138241 RepID=A0AAF3J578_9BILA
MLKYFFVLTLLFVFSKAEKSKDNYGLKKVMKPESLRVHENDQILDILEGDSPIEQKIRFKFQEESNGQLCDVCKTLLESVSEYVKEHESTIPDALNALCDELFHTHQSEKDLCEVIVQSQLKNIIAYIEEGTNPDIAYRRFRLSDAGPSFAIHGVRLNRLQLNRSARSITNCIDQLPFSIDEEPTLVFGDWEEVSFASSNDSTKVNGHFYTSHVVLENKNQITVRETKFNTGDWGISIRLEQWVNDTRKVLVIPGMQKHPEDYFIVLVKETFLVTIVTPSTVFSPYTIMEVFGQGMVMAPTDCPLFQTELTCTRDVLYSVFAGADPGKVEDAGNRLAVETAQILKASSTSTATSLFANTQCAFCLKFNFNGVSYVDMARFSIWSPEFNPWAYDQQEKPTDAPLPKFSIEIQQYIDISSIYVTGYSVPNCSYTTPKEYITEERKVTEKLETWTFTAQCVMISWRPSDIDETLPDTSFLFTVRQLPDCKATYPLLDENSPSFAFHASDLQDYSKNNPLSAFCVETCTGCQLEIEFAYYCEQIDCEPIKEVPFSINAEIFSHWDRDCKRSLTFPNQTNVMSCLLRIEWNGTLARANGKLALVWAANASLANRSAFLVTVPQLFDDDNVYNLLPTFASEIPIQESQNEVWYIVVFPNDVPVRVLKGMYSDPINTECSYDLYILSPHITSNRTDHFLMSINENISFVDFYLESRVYTLKVPSGCSPIVTTEPTNISLSERIVKQDLCLGTTIITTSGYLNKWSPFDEAVPLSHQVTCDDVSSLLIKVNMHALFDGTLTLAFNDTTDGEIDEKSILPGDYPLGYEIIVSNATSVMVSWEPPENGSVHNETQNEAGAFVSVYMEEAEEEPPKKLSSKLWYWLGPLIGLLAMTPFFYIGLKTG